MSERKKKNYDRALAEIIVIRGRDVISTSSPFDTDQVDKNENSWVTPGTNEWS